MLKKFAVKGAVVASFFGMSVTQSWAQRKVVPRAPAKTVAFECTKTLTSSDWIVLLKGVNASNPGIVEGLLADPELRAGQLDNMRELLARACQAVRDGIATKEPYKSELEFIKNQVVAVEYDTLKDKRPDRAPFDSVTAAQVTAFYKIVANEAKATHFLQTKMALLGMSNPENADRQVTVEETKQAKEYFAKVSIMEAESKLRAGTLEARFSERVGLMVKLQQAQFLARIQAEKIADEMVVSDAEIDAYISSHPEFGIAAKRSRAESVLKKAKDGEDFATLANEYSEDPGNRDSENNKLGGLYADVPEGQMVPEFERAALALEQGAISPGLVESDYGFHIIKLERKNGATESEMTYDVRHILISTGIKDPDNPDGREIPVTAFVRKKLEDEKEAAAIKRIIAANPIEIAPLPTALPAEQKPAAKTVRSKPGK